MQTERYLATPGETIVIRVAGLPMGILERLRFQNTTRLIAELLEREQQLQAQAEPLSEALYQVIGSVEEKRVRGSLMALRRAIFQAQMPKRRDLNEQVWTALPGGLATWIAAWLSQMEEWQALLSSGEAVLEAEWTEKRRELQLIAREELFQQGLVLASKDLYADLMNWLHTGSEDPGYADRQLEFGLMTYLSRATTKTSPFSTFTSSGRGRWVNDGPAFVSARHWSRRSMVELSQTVVQYILREMARWPEIRTFLSLQINSSLVEEGGSLSFLGWKGSEAMIRLANSPTLQQTLRVICNAGLPSYETIVQRLAVVDGEQRSAEIARFLDQLIEIGLLEVHLPVTDQSPDHLGQLLAWLQPLQGQRIERIGALLQTLHTYVQQYTTKQANERFDLLERISATLESIYQELGASQQGIQVPTKNAIYEDTMVVAVDGRCARERWRDTLEDLALIQQLSGLYTKFLPARLAVTAFFVDHYGAGESVRLTRFYEEFCKERRQPGGWRANYRVCGMHLVQMLEDLDAPAPARLTELDQVLELRKEIYHWIEQQPIDRDGVRRLDTARLHAFVTDFPSFVTPPCSLDFYCQLLLKDGVPSLVLNALHSGFGRSQARLQRLESQIERRPPAVPRSSDQYAEAPIQVDISGVFYSNANLRAAQTAYEIAYPGVVSARPMEEQLPLTDLSVMHDPCTHQLKLVSERLGQEVLPVHLGLMADFWLPPLCRFLLHTFSVGPANPSLFRMRLPSLPTFEAQQPISKYPRLAIGHAIVERATWIVGAQYLPKREKSTSAFEYMLQVRRWLATHHLPQECFVRILFEQPTSQENWTRRVASPLTMNKNRKPLYIDFSNYLSVMMFEQLVNQTRLALLLQEVLPGRTDLVIADGEASYVSEYILELTLKGEV